MSYYKKKIQADLINVPFAYFIAESPYEQWRRLHNIKLDDVEETRESKAFTTKKKRMFKLELTDGHKKVNAMEYVIIPSLNTKLPPGCKLQIIGPIQIVNHILILEPRNLKILGGDVEDLSIINAYENVLLRAIGKPITNTPIQDYIEEAPLSKENNQRYINVQSRPMQRVAEVDYDEVEMDLEELDRIEEEYIINHRNEGSQEISNNHQLAALLDEDDELLANIDYESIAKETHHKDDEPMEVIEIFDAYQPTIVTANDLCIPTIEIPDDEGDEQHLRDLKTTSAHSSHDLSKDLIPKKIARIEPTRMLAVADDQYKFKSQDGLNMVTVDQYLKLTTTEKMKNNYMILGVLQPDMKTLKVRKHMWQLSGEVADPYSRQKLSVKFHNDVLETVAGVPGLEMKLKHNEGKQQPQLMEDINKVNW